VKALEEAETVLTENILEQKKKEIADDDWRIDASQRLEAWAHKCQDELAKRNEQWAQSGVDPDGGNKLPITPLKADPIDFFNLSPDLFGPSPEVIPDTPVKPPTLKRLFSTDTESLTTEDIFNGVLTQRQSTGIN